MTKGDLGRKVIAIGGMSVGSFWHSGLRLFWADANRLRR